MPSETAACGCNPAGPGPDNAWGDGPPYCNEDCPVHGRPEIIEQPATGCYAQATLQDVDHNFAVCDKRATHADAHEDKLQGVTWTDEHPA